MKVGDIVYFYSKDEIKEHTQDLIVEVFEYINNFKGD